MLSYENKLKFETMINLINLFNINLNLTQLFFICFWKKNLLGLLCRKYMPVYFGGRGTSKENRVGWRKTKDTKNNPFSNIILSQFVV